MISFGFRAVIDGIAPCGATTPIKPRLGAIARFTLFSMFTAIVTMSELPVSPRVRWKRLQQNIRRICFPHRYRAVGTPSELSHPVRQRVNREVIRQKPSLPGTMTSVMAVCGLPTKEVSTEPRGLSLFGSQVGARCVEGTKPCSAACVSHWQSKPRSNHAARDVFKSSLFHPNAPLNNSAPLSCSLAGRVSHWGRGAVFEACRRVMEAAGLTTAAVVASERTRRRRGEETAHPLPEAPL